MFKNYPYYYQNRKLLIFSFVSQKCYKFNHYKIFFNVFFLLLDEDDEQQEEDAEEDDEDEEAGDDEEEDPTIPSQVKSGEIPSTVLNSKVIHISKLPKSEYYFLAFLLKSRIFQTDFVTKLLLWPKGNSQILDKIDLETWYKNISLSFI